MRRSVPTSPFMLVLAAALLAPLGCGESSRVLAPVPTEGRAVVAGTVRHPDATPAAQVTVMLEPMVGGALASGAMLRTAGRASRAARSASAAGGRGTLDAAPRVTTTDAAGRLAFPDVDEGAYFVTSSALDHRSGLRPRRRREPATDAAETTFVNIALTPPDLHRHGHAAERDRPPRHFVYVLGPSNVAATDAAGRLRAA